jgi:hemolysin type calcium-binding protein
VTDSKSLRIWGALFTVVVTAVMLVVPLGGVSSASAVTITAVNPENGGPGSVVSDKDSSTDGVYHFVARISDADIDVPGHIPSGNVQVRIDDSDADTDPDRVLLMTRVGTTDTWETFWDAGADYPTIILSGPGTVTFFVQDALGSTDTDSEAVTLAPAPTALPIPDPRETVEITAPANGGSLGFFNNQAVVQGTVSEGTTSTDTVSLFYSTVAANAEPTWTQCGNGAITDNASGQDTFQGTCTLATGTDPTNVTIIGARVAAASTANLDSGDAHRITGFTQTLTTVAIVPAQTTGAVGRCSTFTVQARGQTGAPISGLNVDVHMTGGATDNSQDDLQFATNAPVEGAASDPYTSPNSNHISVEPAAGCDQAGPAFPPIGEPDGIPDDNDSENVSDGTPTLGEAGTQGFHPSATGPDTHHIEGTSDANGNWRFSIDAEQVGAVNLRAWIDLNNDDVETAEPVANLQHTFGPFTPPPPVVDATPETDSNPIGTSHTIDVSVGQSGAPAGGRTVQFRVTTGPHADNDLDSNAGTPPGVFGPCVTNAAGTCSDSYNGVEAGTDRIQVWIDTNNNFNLDAGESSDPDGVEKIWTAAAEAVSATPQTATNNVGQTHTITATVTSGPVPAAGRVVQFRVTNGPHFDNDLDSNANTPVGVFGPCTTGANGQCTDSYVGTEAGDDSRIEVWIDLDGDFTVDSGEAAEPGGVEKNWTALAVTVEASPASDTNNTGESHSVTATVREGGNLAQNKTVTFKVTGGPHASDDLDNSASTPGGVFGQCQTAVNGQCSGSYTGTKTGQDQITVFVDGDADFTPETGEPSTQVTKTWTSAPPASIDCVPEVATGAINNSHTVTATVRNASGGTVSGATVAFQVRTGPHADNDLDSNGATPTGFFGSGTTDGSGNISKSYTGTEATGNNGNDIIDCWIDANANNQDDNDAMDGDGGDADTTAEADEQIDTGEVSDYVDKTWAVTQPPPPPPQNKCPGASTVPGNHIVGTNGSDTLTGTSGPDVICGLGGNDSISGLGSDDLILGGDGADTIRGGDGDDLIFSQAGNDVVFGNAGDDRISGGSENDRIDGGDDDDRIWGVGGNDTIYGGFGNDRIVGNAGDDRLVGGPGLDTGYGLAGADRLFFRDGIRDFRVDGGTGVDACSRDASDPVDECP